MGLITKTPLSRVRAASIAGCVLVLVPLVFGAESLQPQRILQPLGEDGPRIAEFAGRTLVAGIEVDRDGARLVSYTVKPRAFVETRPPAAPRPYVFGRDVQIEVRLEDSNGVHYTRRIDAGPLCLSHGATAKPHVMGDTIRLHRDAFVLELPEATGFDRLEIAYYEDERGSLARRSLATETLDAARFTPAGGSIPYTELAIARPTDEAPPLAPSAATVQWPEDFADPDVYQVFGEPAEGDRRINIAIVPDGYRYAEKGLMETHAAAMVDYFRSKTPYAEHDAFTNYTLVYAYSADSGADECDCGVVVDSAMGTRFPDQNPQCGSSDNRCLYYGSGCDTVGTSNIVAAELRAPFHDETIVMVNTSRYGGCGGLRSVYSAANPSAVEIAVHELGHSLGGLADEYAYNGGCGVNAGEINTSMDPVHGAWPEWIAELGGPYQGGQYYQQCVYRPVSNCEMRNLGQPFCAVCNQHWSLVTFGHPRVAPTAPIESTTPELSTAAWVGVPADFSAITRLSSGPQIENQFTWKVRAPGDLLPTVVATGSTEHTHVFDREGLHAVILEVIADTNFVKPVKYGANVDLVTWDVAVTTLLPPEEVSAPDSTEPLRFLDVESLTWEDATGSGAFAYNLYRGALADLAAGEYGSCLTADLAGPSTGVPESPPPSTTWFYLVAGVNPAGEGPLGTSSSGAPRAAAVACD